MDIRDTLPLTSADLDALEALRDDVWVEVEDGYIIEVARDMTYFHLLIIENIYDHLKAFLRSSKLGRVHTDGVRYILSGGKRGVRLARKPDASFIRAQRFPPDFDPSGDIEGAPDLAVEVVSPGQSTPLMLGRVADYLAHGAEEVWVVYPSRREVWVYRADAETPTAYHAGDTLTSPMFMGWAMPVAAIFATDAP
jgi:Uma2 family endonuclease